MKHRTEKYLKTSEADLEVIKCPICMNDAYRIISFGLKQNTQELGYPYVEHNMGEAPVEVQSRGHRKQLLKERNLREYTSPRNKGRAGQWV